MSWFGRKSAPASTPAWPPFMAAADSDALPRSYQGRLAEVFINNPVGQRSVRLVAGTVAALPIDQTEGREQVRALVARPQLLETIASQLLLHGNAYLYCVEGPNGLAELSPLRPEKVSVSVDERGWPAAYVYRAGGRPVRYPARDKLARRQVIHLRALHPGDDQMGLGCMDAAISAASLHNRATRWNKSLLDNGARPSGAMVYEPGDGSSLTADQVGRLREQIEAHFSGTQNAGRPLLLEGGLKWQSLSLSPSDMDFVALKEAAGRDIALAFGVPPVLLGLPGDTAYANLREAGRALYRQTVLPLAERMLDGLADGLSDWFGKVSFAVDVDRISELIEDRERLWQRIEAATFLSRNEKREQLGFKPENRE
ncbi:phage portal protein [Sphingomonas sp. BN140010]|uniref:Phage portal protein n=1 Tax=Sphingomonas arvum TaxID=2992113 RepID=A0ABT3JIJ4_9SPHN|nr:phage portal protein [Sphingomonas sp. BN140010]MCW3798611.1 phage portal protein [Sphingomonas sp. BN140010]